MTSAAYTGGATPEIVEAYRAAGIAAHEAILVVERVLAAAPPRDDALVTELRRTVATLRDNGRTAKAIWAEGEAFERQLAGNGREMFEVATRLMVQTAAIAERAMRDARAGARTRTWLAAVLDAAVPSLPGAPRASDVLDRVSVSTHQAVSAASDAGLGLIAGVGAAGRLVAFLLSPAGLALAAAVVATVYFRSELRLALRKAVR